MTGDLIGNSPPAETVFETSGSTGRARRWARSHQQMRTEVELVTACTLSTVDFVINYSPPRHLFGALFGQLLPQLRGVPVVQAWEDPLKFPDIPTDARVLVVCVPMTWDLLRRNWRKLAIAGSVSALHSSATPPGIAHDLVDDTGMAAHELLGSTETGGIAYRALNPNTIWQLLPDVTVPHGNGGDDPRRLVVCSPRIARPETALSPPAAWATGDLVEFTSSGTFRLVGRESAMVKVNGLKLHLSQVEQQLGRTLPGATFVPIRVPSRPLGGEGYVVFWTAGGTTFDSDDVRSALRHFPAPVDVVELPSMPTTPSGKPDRPALAERLTNVEAAPTGGESSL